MRRLPVVKPSDTIYVIVVLSATVVFLWLPSTTPELVKNFDREGGSVELLSAIFYLVGLLACLYRIVGKVPYHRPYLYLWAILCFLFFGEETSWLQHIIGYGTPDAIREVNVQGEFNLHNLLEDGSWHEALTSGKLDYKMFLSTTALFRLGFLTYFLLIPVIMRAGLFKGPRRRLKMPLPAVGFIVSLIATLSLSLLGYYFNPELRMDLTEAREMYYALFIMLYVLFYSGTKNGLDPESDPAS